MDVEMEHPAKPGSETAATEPGFGNIKFAEIFDGGFTRPATEEEIASAKPCNPISCGNADHFEEPEDAVADAQGTCSCGFNEIFEKTQAAMIEASQMSQRALDRAEQVLIRAEGAFGTDVDRLMAIHDRWLHFAEMVSP